MSYTIEYNPQMNSRYPKAIRHPRKGPRIIIPFLILLSLYFINKWDIAGMRSLWFGALETLADRIKTGTEIGESIAQCISLLNG